MAKQPPLAFWLGMALLGGTGDLPAQPDVNDATNHPKILIVGRGSSLLDPSASTNAETATAGVTNLVVAAPAPDFTPMVEALQSMVEQQKEALQAIEQTRLDAEARGARDAEQMETRLREMQAALERQREREADAVARMNSVLMWLAGGFAVAGFVVLVGTGWFFTRTARQVAEITGSRNRRGLMLPPVPDPHEGGGSIVSAVTGPSIETASRKLMSTLDLLEKRIKELEHTAGVEQAEGDPLSISDMVAARAHDPRAAGRPRGDGLEVDASTATTPSDVVDAGADDGDPWLTGQRLLEEDRPNEAIRCFDQVLAADPGNHEALLKKGTALEKLRRLDEALMMYDAAIEANEEFTMAYLAKGGVCNRLERYSEALDCYQKALKTQHKKAAV